MVTLPFVAFAVGLLGLFGPGAASARVVLIGVDGGSWNLIDRGIAAGELPHLAAIAARPPAEKTGEEADDADVTERLRSLGYVE